MKTVFEARREFDYDDKYELEIKTTKDLSVKEVLTIKSIRQKLLDIFGGYIDEEWKKKKEQEKQNKKEAEAANQLPKSKE